LVLFLLIKWNRNEQCALSKEQPVLSTSSVPVEVPKKENAKSIRVDDTTK